MERTKTPVADLATQIEEAKSKYNVRDGVVFCHNKTGDHYIVRGLAVDCKTNGLMVIYCKEKFQSVLFTRPLEQWVEVPEGTEQARFTEVTD